MCGLPEPVHQLHVLEVGGKDAGLGTGKGEEVFCEAREALGFLQGASQYLHILFR